MQGLETESSNAFGALTAFSCGAAWVSLPLHSLAQLCDHPALPEKKIMAPQKQN
jgi:hypothetical protein